MQQLIVPSCCENTDNGSTIHYHETRTNERCRGSLLAVKHTNSRRLVRRDVNATSAVRSAPVASQSAWHSLADQAQRPLPLCAGPNDETCARTLRVPGALCFHSYPVQQQQQQQQQPTVEVQRCANNGSICLQTMIHGSLDIGARSADVKAMSDKTVS